MTWADLYLICFIVGFALSAISVLGGLFEFHLPGFEHGHFHMPDANGHHGTGHVSPFNFPTIAAFMAWFGGVGYLLTRFSGIWQWLVFLIAVGGGTVGGSIIFFFLFRVLLGSEHQLTEADFDMIGVLGQLTSGIREGGTGEMSFTQAGTRRSANARSEDGTAIPRGAEVVVTRYDKGVAYVRPWDDENESKETL